MKALSINNLKKEYAGGLQALKGIDLEVSQGDFFALLGPNGAGKSTTIGIISSLVTKTSGQVKILDIDIDENHSLAKKKLGVVGQEVNFNQFEKVGDIIRNQAGYHGLSFKEARENVLKEINAKKETLDKQIDEEIKKVEQKINLLRKGASEKINKIAIETTSELLVKLIGTEVNNSSISAIVDDLSKRNGDKYYGN